MTAPLFIESEGLNAPYTSAEETAGYLTTPAMYPQLTADKPPPPAYFAARQLLYTWLLVTAGKLRLPEIADPAARVWFRLDFSEQVDLHASDTYEKLTACG